MSCSEINNLLPAYREDALPLGKKKLIESHLTSCALCNRNLAALKEAEYLVRGLGEVEPPPFFEQRVMARVREEAGRKKGIFLKFFYPLYIKIPIQALATILVAVLAFYVYQKNESEIKQRTPFPTPLIESEKGRITSESSKPFAPPSAVKADKRAPIENLPDKDQERFAAAPSFENRGKADKGEDSPSPKQEEHPLTIKSGAPILAAREKEAPTAREEALIKAQDKAEKQGIGKAPGTPLLKQKRKSEMAESGDLAEKDRVMKSLPAASRLMTAPDEKGSAVDLTIQVRDPNVAVREIEERLTQAGAGIIERVYREEKGFLKTEIAAQKVTQFLNNLETIGKVNLDKNTLEGRDGKVTVTIKIITHP